jgi:hypothetical protein
MGAKYKVLPNVCQLFLFDPVSWPGPGPKTIYRTQLGVDFVEKSINKLPT